MLIGCMRVSSADDRQSTDLRRDALLAAGVDERHLRQDRASGARDDRPGLKACLKELRAGDTLVVWKSDRLGRSLPRLLSILGDLRERGTAFRSPAEHMDTASPQGEPLFAVFAVFGALAQRERALIRERVMAGLRSAEVRGRRGGRPRAISDEKLAAIRAALEGGMSKAAACRIFRVRRTTLIEAFERSGWGATPRGPTPVRRAGRCGLVVLGSRRPRRRR